ncbi:MAG: carboxymuconolactone decarboxylase family protein [Candidatus Jordarchaeales archaeon]
MSSKVEEVVKSLQKFSEDFPEEFQKFIALVSAPYSFFDVKTREIIITTILAAKGYENEFKFHLNELMRSGFTKEELKNFLLLLLIYLGAPRFLQVLRWCKEEGKL